MNSTDYIHFKPILNFVKVPNTAGEVLTGLFDTKSQDSIFKSMPNR